MKRSYTKPHAETLGMELYPMMALNSGKDNTLHHSGTQTDSQGPATGSNEAHQGGEEDVLEGAKGWSWDTFDE